MSSETSPDYHWPGIDGGDTFAMKQPFLCRPAVKLPVIVLSWVWLFGPAAKGEVSPGKAGIEQKGTQWTLSTASVQETVALENGKNLDRAVGGTGLRLGRRRRLYGLDLRISERQGDVGCQSASEKDGEKTAECERDSVQVLPR